MQFAVTMGVSEGKKNSQNAVSFILPFLMGLRKLLF